MVRTQARAQIAALLLAGLAAVPQAWASGADKAEDSFVSRAGTDVALDRYDKGELGVLLPSYPRVYLYPAWRAIVLGAEGLRQKPALPGGLQQAVGRYVDGWIDDKHPYHEWRQASGQLVQRPVVASPPVYRSLSKGGSMYLNCAAPAFVFATQNLELARQRADATPQRLRDWITAQDTVFDFCDYDPTVKPRPGAAPPPVVPAPLATREPLWWQQMRDYQVATAHFYNDAYAESGRRFERIAATAGHPMQRWGAYLALRSQVRALTHDSADVWHSKRQALRNQLSPDRRAAALAIFDAEQDKWQRAAMASLIAQAQRILADPTLKAVHEPTHATLRAARFRLLPGERLDALSRQLDDTAQDPHRDSTLGDWRRLANELLEYRATDHRESLEAAMRARHPYFDWMRSLQRCGLAGVENLKPEQSCAAERAHAMERWQATPAKGEAGEHQAWMVAVLMLSGELSPALEQAALAVAPTAPEYLTVRYNLARLYRLSGQAAKARELSEAVLKAPQLAGIRSNSAVVLFQQERFASARSLDDAAAYLTRTSLWQVDRDTGETLQRKESEALPQLASDGLAWVNTRLAVADLLLLAKMDKLPARIRASITVAAWLRADLLGQAAQADEAAALAKSLPALSDAASAYLAAANRDDKRHTLMLSSLRLGLSPVVSDRPFARQTSEAEEPVASMWCSIVKPEAGPNPWNGHVEQVPPPPDLSTQAAVRDREISLLGKVPTATGFVGEHALRRASTHPADPELAWLLHVVVQSTRGGCVGPSNSALSRSAYKLLHSRFKNTQWARKTPYWY